MNCDSEDIRVVQAACVMAASLSGFPEIHMREALLDAGIAQAHNGRGIVEERNNDDIVQATLKAMASWRKSACVQQHACIILRNLTEVTWHQAQANVTIDLIMTLEFVRKSPKSLETI